MKGAFHTVRISLLIVLAAFLLLVAVFGYQTRLKRREIVTSVSPDFTYQLNIDQIGDPDWPFGAAHCRLTLRCGWQTICRTYCDILNDGGSARSNNFSIQWAADYVSVVADSDETPTVVYYLYFDGETEVIRS